jgi:hypothetical protein
VVGGRHHERSAPGCPAGTARRSRTPRSANNADEATLYVLDVATMKRSEIDVIEGAKYA